MSNPFLDFISREKDVEYICQELLTRITSQRRERLLSVIRFRTFNVAPVLENIYDHGNVSAVMRSAEAFGFINFHIVERPGSKFKTANRVANGADKWLITQKHESTANCVDALKADGFKIYATHLEATTTIEEVDFSQKSAIVFGNEKEGVSPEMIEKCDGVFLLPMYGFAQSFNISVAAALCFSIVHQMRKEKIGKAGDLNELQMNQLLAWYLLKSVDSAEKILERQNQNKKQNS